MSCERVCQKNALKAIYVTVFNVTVVRSIASAAVYEVNGKFDNLQSYNLRKSPIREK